MSRGKYIRSKETRNKLSQSLRGKLLGVKRGPQSEEHRRKISESNQGKVFSVETRRKIGIKFIGRKLSVEHRKNISESLKGERSYLWRGGITAKNQQIRSSFEYRLWREAVFKRDNWTCVWCGKRSKKNNPLIIHADHVRPFSKYPELRFAIDNGRTLCIGCHKTTGTYLNQSRWDKTN